MADKQKREVKKGNERIPVVRAKFERPKSRKRFKTAENYLKAIFKLNKDKIIRGLDKAAEGSDIPPSATYYERFKQNILEISETGRINMTAIAKYERSWLFQEYKDYSFQNIRRSLINQDMWEEFRRLNRHQKWAPEKLRALGNKQFIYDNKIVISFRNSPETVEMYKLSKDQISSLETQAGIEEAIIKMIKQK